MAASATYVDSAEMPGLRPNFARNACANFLLVGLHAVGGDGRPWFQKLAAWGVIVRALIPYGLPRHIRITVGAPAENNRLLAAIRRILRS